MKTIEIQLYSYEELSPKAKEYARDKWNENNYDVLYFFNDDCKEQAKEKGFEGIELSYRLSYSQGDGLSFSAKQYTKLKELFVEVLGKGKESTAQLLADNCTVIMKGNTGHYCYASKSDIDVYLENYTSSINVTNTNRIDEVIAKVLEKLEDIYMSLCEELEKQGYAEIEYQESEEAFKETCEANGYTFEANGTMRNF